MKGSWKLVVLAVGLVIGVWAMGERLSWFKPRAAFAARGRVRIVSNRVVAENGAPIRGENMHAGHDYGIDEIKNDSQWLRFRDQYRLNTMGISVFRNTADRKWELQYYESIEMPIDKNDPADPFCFNGTNPRCSTGVAGNGKYQVDIFDYLDTAVAQCEKFGMYCQIQYRSEQVPNKADLIYFWKKVAPRYKDRTNVFYEAVTEPADNFLITNYGPSDIQTQKDVYSLIRSLAPQTHVTLWTFANADSDMLVVVDQGSQGSLPISYANASVGVHAYSGTKFSNLSNSVWPRMRNLKAKYPVLVTEFCLCPDLGYPDYTVTKQATQNLETEKISWIWLHNVPGGYPTSEVFWPADPYYGGQPGGEDRRQGYCRRGHGEN